ncbi:MAG: carboxypeptidase regulatory-like domain-containing protein [Thermoanaerobaculia bacterium]|nr:carboxypeptidase regulatory-like domain-containing protein [Thermoanaerobaculia bacterium]
MPWRVKYAAQDRVPGTYKEILEEVVSETGWVRLEGLQPGKYLLLVEGAEGDQWHGEELTIERSPPPHHVAVEIVKVKGRVLLGKKPLASTLFFGGRFGATRIKLVAGADGNFEGFLPREGRWQLDVLASKPRVSRRIESVEVSRQQGEDAAFVKIVLPATRVTGVVVDERGEPPRRALVRATPFAGKMQEPLTSVTISAEDAGRFVFEGFPEGGLLLSAEVGADWESERLLVNVAEGVEPPEAKLVVRPVRRFHGRVVSAGGQPVPGASIEVMPLGVAMAFVENEPAKFDGSFSFRMPPEARQAAMTVAAPGFALRSRLISLEQRETLVVSVDQVGGAVELRFPENNGKGATKLWPVLYGPSGVGLNAGQISKWAVLNGEVPQAGGFLRAPNVEAGQYTLCLVPESAGASQQAAPPPGGRCSTGYLPPLGSLQLAIDGPAVR